MAAPRTHDAWPGRDAETVEGQLAEYEAKYLGGGPRYTGTLRNGARPNWQLRWVNTPT